VNVKRGAQQVVMTVHDDGMGLATRKGPASPQSGFGLTGMSERASLLHGTLSVQTDPQGGTTVRLSAPIENDREDGKDAKDSDRPRG
jgi:signal transduction histidine kinase